MDVTIIGTGRIGLLLENDELRSRPCTHIGTINKLAAEVPFNVRAICDLNNENLKNAENYLKQSKFQHNFMVTKDYKKALDQQSELVVIATNTDSHAKILCEALNHKPEYVIIEKPVCTSIEELEKIKKCEEQSDTTIIVNFERRFHYKYRKIKQIVANKVYGDVKSYRGLVSSRKKDLYINSTDEGLLLHDTSHMVDLVMFVFGEITKFEHLKQNAAHHLFLSHSRQFEGEILTINDNGFFHFDLDIIFDKARIQAGNGYFYIQEAKNSIRYKNFYSLTDVLDNEQALLKQAQAIKEENPFINLYRSLKTGEVEPGLLQAALMNTRILTTY